MSVLLYPGPDLGSEECGTFDRTWGIQYETTPYSGVTMDRRTPLVLFPLQDGHFECQSTSTGDPRVQLTPNVLNPQCRVRSGYSE